MKTKINLQERAEIYKDQDGWWADYKDGWCSSMDRKGALHSDHDDTKAKITRLVRDAVKCDCEQCVTPTQLEQLRAG